MPPKFTTKTDVLLFLVFRKFILFLTSDANVVTWNAGYARKCTIF